ncbi:DegV family EDD domain-containing protein [Paenibacillus timonensis]|uniref:DegV family protein n=1 Tax=Paenibacillus rhizolycopersici TaxID=2780073 RepID=UPI0012D9E15C|nr:DegV family protein [Paenibacillus timonensis]MUG87571.1 DegV family EDD domain-containing protein [Paenibacillus timonensis]
MTLVKIFADSISDLPEAWARAYDIGIVPLYVVFGETAYKDKLEITTADIYRRVDEDGVLPRTAAPAPADFIAAFSPWIEQGHTIVYISMSSKLSSSYQNALIAAAEFPEGRIHVVDSLNVSGGIALLVLKAAIAAKQGTGPSELVSMLEEMRERVEIEVLVDSLDYLHKGGRASSVQYMIGSLLKIRPVLKVKEGLVISADKYRGKTEKAIERMLHNFIDNVHKVDRELIIVAQTLAEKAAGFIRNTLLEKTDVKEVSIIEGGCAISCHCGPRTVAIMYLRQPNSAI